VLVVAKVTEAPLQITMGGTALMLTPGITDGVIIGFNVLDTAVELEAHPAVEVMVTVTESPGTSVLVV
jgi:hypothetical protein